jgi:hypothetical protein
VYLGLTSADEGLQQPQKALEGRGIPLDQETTLRLPRPDVIGSVAKLAQGHEPLLMMPMGYKKGG